MKTIPVPVELFQALGAYLVERPYREVASLLEGMQQAATLAQAKTPQPVPDAPAKAKGKPAAEPAA